jgi:hypothetical protein
LWNPVKLCFPFVVTIAITAMVSGPPVKGSMRAYGSMLGRLLIKMIFRGIMAVLILNRDKN